MSESPWASFARFFDELAPVVGPLFESLSETFAAIDRVSGGTTPSRRALPSAAIEEEE